LKRDEKDDPNGEGLVQVEPTKLTYFMHAGYRGVPFLFEMRSFLDWWFIDSCLDLVEWIKLSDIHATLFTVSYLRTLEKNDKRYVGELQIWWYKHLAGGGAFLLGVLLIWGPLFIFSGSSPFLKESASQGVTLTTDLATPWTSFQLTLTSTNLVSMYNNDDATRDSLGDRDSETPLGRRTVLIKRQRRVGEAVQKVNFGLTPSIDFSPPPGLVSQLLRDTNPADGVKYGLLHPTAGIPYTGMFSMKAQFSNSCPYIVINEH
jgi:hypothetical protein